MSAALPHGPIVRALHLVIDMQPLFQAAGPWPVAGIEAALPGCARLLSHAPGAAAFARFIPPHDPQEAPGQWADHFRRWPEATRAALPP